MDSKGKSLSFFHARKNTYSNDDIHEHKLRHQHEDDEEYGSDDGADAAVADAVDRTVTVLS